MEENNEYGVEFAVQQVALVIAAVFVVLVVHAGVNSCADYVTARAFHAYGLWIGLVCWTVGFCGAGIGGRKLFLIPGMVGFVLLVYGASYVVGGKEILPFTWEVRLLEPVLDQLYPDAFSGWDAPEDPHDYPQWECKRY